MPILSDKSYQPIKCECKTKAKLKFTYLSVLVANSNHCLKKHSLPLGSICMVVHEESHTSTRGRLDGDGSSGKFREERFPVEDRPDSHEGVPDSGLEHSLTLLPHGLTTSLEECLVVALHPQHLSEGLSPSGHGSLVSERSWWETVRRCDLHCTQFHLKCHAPKGNTVERWYKIMNLVQVEKF